MGLWSLVFELVSANVRLDMDIMIASSVNGLSLDLLAHDWRPVS